MKRYSLKKLLSKIAQGTTSDAYGFSNHSNFSMWKYQIIYWLLPVQTLKPLERFGEQFCEEFHYGLTCANCYMDWKLSTQSFSLEWCRTFSGSGTGCALIGKDSHYGNETSSGGTVVRRRMPWKDISRSKLVIVSFRVITPREKHLWWFSWLMLFINSTKSYKNQASWSYNERKQF